METPSASPESFRNLENKHPVRWVLDILLERRILFSSIIIGIIIHQSLRFVIPVIIGDLVEFGIEAGDKNQVKYYSTLLISIALISAFFDLTMSWLNEIAANDVEYKTRDIYFKSVQNKNMAFHDEARLGELLSIAQNDLRSLYTAVAPGLRLFGEAMISILVVTVLIFVESALLGFVFLILLPIWFYFLRRYNNSMTPAAVDQQQKFRDLSANVNENLMATKIVRAFSQEEYELEQFNQSNVTYTNSWNHRGKVTSLFYPMLLTYSLSGVMFFLGIYLVQNPTIEFGSYTYNSDFDIPALITVMGIIILFRQPTYFVGATLELASLGLAGVEKVQKIIVQGSSEEKELNLENDYVVSKGSINFDNVDFEYNSTPILKGITFKVNAGEVVAIVGPPGSGKTTIMKLLARFYEPTKGKILIDNRQITEYDLITLRKSIGVVEQDVHLFSDSIANNITYAFDDGIISSERLDEVLKLSRINEFVHDLPDGLETVVGEKGSRLSGGQKQRVAIARAFLTDPKILVLDDSTSAIDAKTESEIVGAIKDLMKGRTSFLITNRLNMMRQADRIIVLDKGSIEAEGKHQDLIQTNRIYKRIFQPFMDSEGES